MCRFKAYAGFDVRAVDFAGCTYRISIFASFATDSATLKDTVLHAYFDSMCARPLFVSEFPLYLIVDLCIASPRRDVFMLTLCCMQGGPHTYPACHFHAEMLHTV